MGYRFIIYVIFFLAFKFNSNAQDKYAVDLKNKNDRRVPLSYLITESGKQFKEAHLWRKNNRRVNRASRKTQKHIYKIQTAKVKKRMKRAEKKAENYNRGKVPLRVKLKRIISNG